jgi:hypothetical protein
VVQSAMWFDLGLWNMWFNLGLGSEWFNLRLQRLVVILAVVRKPMIYNSSVLTALLWVPISVQRFQKGTVNVHFLPLQQAICLNFAIVRLFDHP